MAYLYLFYPLIVLLLSSFWLWMLVDALKKHRPWAWVIVLAFVPILSAPIYYVNFYFLGTEREGILDSNIKFAGRIRAYKAKLEQDGLVGDKRNLADAYFESQNYREALNLLKDVLQHDGEDLRSQFQAGVSLLAIGQAKEALPHLDYVLDQEPRFYQGDARLIYANALFESGEVERARQEYERTASHFNIPEAVVRTARFLIEEGKFEEAYKMLLLMLQTVQLTERQQRTQKVWIKKAAEEIQKLKKLR